MEPKQSNVANSIPWREAFPEYREEDLPGVSLLGARTKEGMTQTRLAELTGIPRFERHDRPAGRGGYERGRIYPRKSTEAS
jgi:hypothetical protein